MIRVNIWLPDNINVGHASAEIGCSEEAHSTYISWWPTSNVLKSNSGSPSTYEQDCISEKCEPDERIEIDGLNEESASKWWLEFTTSNKANYNLSWKNCSWAVVSALKAGGSDDYFPWHRLFEKYNVEPERYLKLILDIPNIYAVTDYIVSVFKIIKSDKSWVTVLNQPIEEQPWSFALKRPIVDIADRNFPIWSPRDVLFYCELLKAGIEGTDDFLGRIIADFPKVKNISHNKSVNRT